MIVYLSFGYWLLLWLTAAPNSESKIKENYPNLPVFDQVRQRFLDSLSGVSPDAEALVAGLTIGERDLVSQELKEQMRDLSLTHLVAVSGANLAIVLAAIYFLTASVGIGRNLRFIIALGLMAMYVLLVGPESSVIRAATMALFVMLNIWIGRGSRPIYALSSAILLLLIIDPGLATDVGFGLSALATAGLVVVTPYLFERFSRRMNKVLAAALSATIAAQLYTLPIILYLQPSLPTYSILANLMVEWVVAPVTILGMIAVIASIFHPGLAAFISWLASHGTNWIVIASSSLEELPFVRAHFLPAEWGIAAAVVIAASTSLWLLGGRHSRVGLSTLVVSVLVCVSWIASDLLRRQTFAGEWQIFACDVGQGDALLVRSKNQVALIDVGPQGSLLSRCLAEAGVNRIHLLVITHFDADHVGGMDGLAGIDVENVLVSPLQDDRPLVEKFEQTLEIKGVRANYGFSGLTGELGDIGWQVLNPSPTAREAADSNDASLALVFDFGQFSLLTLADLGESGQKRVLSQHQLLIAQMSQRPLVMKVAHHGSADQYEQLYEVLDPDISLFLVGENRYGHPTPRVLDLNRRLGAAILRTDTMGPVAIAFESSLRYRLGGKLSA